MPPESWSVNESWNVSQMIRGNFIIWKNLREKNAEKTSSQRHNSRLHESTSSAGDLERDLLLKMLIRPLSYCFKVKSVLTGRHGLTSRINDTETTICPSNIMVWFVKVETAVWCSKEPHAVRKASARLNQSRQNKDTAKKVSWTWTDGPAQFQTR